MSTEPASPSVTVSVDFKHRFREGLRANAAIYTMIIVLVMAIAAFAVAITGVQKGRVIDARLANQIACQSEYNKINNERTRQINEVIEYERIAEERSDKALAAFVSAAQKAAPLETRIKLFNELDSALKEQEKARELVNKERREHPVPPPPENLCGSAN